MKETPSKRAVRLLWFIGCLMGIACAGLGWLLVTGSFREYRGRTLQEWLHTPRSRQMEVQVSHFTNAVQAFHEAGPQSVKVLLAEIGAPAQRMDRLLSDLGNRLQMRGWFRQGLPRLLHDPEGRSFAAQQMALELPPLSDESLRLLTQEFEHLSAGLRALGPEPGAERQEHLHWVHWEGRALREGQLSAVADWIGQNGDRGLSFLTNQVFQTSESATQLAVLPVLKRANLSPAAVVPVLVHAARNPKVAYLAARHLTDLHREPTVAIPALTQAAAKGNVTAAGLIGEWGTNAAPWLPAILALTTNANPQVSFQAEIAVRKIQGR